MTDKPTDAARLAALRAQIDRLDEALLRLIGERQSLMGDVRKAKGAHATMPLRPARERERMVAIAAKAKDAGAPPASLLAIWRELIGAAVMRQSPVTICAPPALLGLARAGFGQAMTYRATDGALEAAAADAATLAVLPLEGSWWRAALPANLQVVAALPLWQAAGEGLAIRALCVGAAMVAPSQDLPQVRQVFASAACPPSATCLVCDDTRSMSLCSMAAQDVLPAGARGLGYYLPPLELGELA